MLKYYCTIYFSLLFLCYGTTALASQTRITNFNQAKIAAIAIHKEATSFYCGCKIQWQGRKGLVDHASCGYQIRRNLERANRIEWEHVMPAAHFGYRLKCWQSGGRTHCEDNKRYIKMETDLHNLQPAIGEINENRSNFQFSQWHGSATQYGQCEMKIDFKNRLAEPPEHTRGAIARTYFYMRDQYKIKLSNSQTQLMKVWNVLYPVTEWECERDKRIAAVQGNHNLYVLNACLSIN